MRRWEFVASLGGATIMPVAALTQQPTPPQDSTAHWVSYGGSEAILLAMVLLVVAGGLVYAGKRLRTPLEIERPGVTVAGFMIAIWLMALYTVIVATFVHGLQVKQAYPGFVGARVRVGTFVSTAAPRREMTSWSVVLVSCENRIC